MEQEGNELMTDALYEIKNQEKETYGTKVGVKSNGEWLMEVKGSGDVVSVPKNQLEEVLPYTVEVGFGNGKVHYTTEAGAFKVGDIVVVRETNLGAILAVDTKYRSATDKLKCFKLEGKFVGSD